MSHRIALVSVLSIALVLAVQPAQAALLAAYDLVGTDAVGDGKLILAAGQAYPACGTGFGCDKYDILSLEMADAGDSVHVKLNVGDPYAGLAMIMYAVHFKVAGTSYYTCWTVQSAGTTTQSQDVNENSVGCSRFAGETQVGPATRADGVENAADAAGQVYVLWAVSKESIGGAALLTDITAEIWNRSPSNCCAGSTTQAQYVWNRNDVAPDSGVWTYAPAPAAPALTLNATVEPDNATVGPGASPTFSVMTLLGGNGSANYTLNVSGLPAGWNSTWDVENGSLSQSASSSSHMLTVDVPEDATNQTVNLTVDVLGSENLTASVNITITVDTTLATPDAPTGADDETDGTDGAGGNSTVEDNDTATAKDADGKGIPNVGAAFAGLTLVAAAWISRRRA